MSRDPYCHHGARRGAFSAAAERAVEVIEKQ